MPYIRQALRRFFDPVFQAQSAGELNYYITKACLVFLSGTERKYNDYNTVIGALECAKLEMYRRMVAPYEDKKIKENGDL